MKPRLYLETTIPSYLVARRSRDLRLAADQETTQQWWEAERHDYELFISQAVVSEVSKGDANFANARLDHLRDLPLLPRTPEASALITHLLASGLIPAVAEDDAAHIGLAAAHGMDFLRTWNCRHINNHHIRARIKRACAVFDLVCPDICTPAELMKPQAMKENEILEEIHRIRAEHAAECGYDVNVMFARMDAELERLQAQGWRVVAPEPRKKEAAHYLREELPQQK